MGKPNPNNIMDSGPIKAIYADGKGLKTNENYNYIDFIGRGGFGLIFRI